MSAIQRHQEPESEGDQTQLSPEECFDILSNPRRRYAIQYLRTCENGVSVGKLADEIAAWETGHHVKDVSADARKRVYTSLRQIHLPRMDQLNVIEYDAENKRITLGATVEEIDVCLEQMRDPDVAWHRLYLTLACVNAGLLLLVGLSVPVLTAVPTFGWAVISVTSFLGTTLVHAYRRQKRHVVSLAPPNPES